MLAFELFSNRISKSVRCKLLSQISVFPLALPWCARFTSTRKLCPAYSVVTALHCIAYYNVITLLYMLQKALSPIITETISAHFNPVIFAGDSLTREMTSHLWCHNGMMEFPMQTLHGLSMPASIPVSLPYSAQDRVLCSLRQPIV